MIPKIKEYPNNASVIFTHTESMDTPYLVKLYNGLGDLVDRVRCDDRKIANDYFKSFCKIAKGL